MSPVPTEGGEHKCRQGGVEDELSEGAVASRGHDFAARDEVADEHNRDNHPKVEQYRGHNSTSVDRLLQV